MKYLIILLALFCMGCGFGYVRPTADGGAEGVYVGWGGIKSEKVEIESKPPIQVGEIRKD